MLKTLPLLVCLGAGIVGGVFFAFSTFVMKALADGPAPHGIATMQRINVSVLGPLFLGVFVGTAVLAGICVVAGFFPWGETKSLLLFAAGFLYGWTQGRDLETCGHYGSVAAAEVISHVGPRPLVELRSLIGDG